MSSGNFAQIPEGLLYDGDISHVAVRAYGIIQRYAGKKGKAFPGREELAEKMGVSVETVKRALAELVSAGWAERTRRPGTNIWDTAISRVPQQKARVTSDPTPRVASDPRPPKHGSSVTRRRVTDDPTVGSLVTRLVEREPLNESQLTRDTAPASGDAADDGELPLGLPALAIRGPDPIQVLVGAYVLAVQAEGGIATKSQRGAIGRNVKRLIDDDGIPLPVLLVAVQRAGARRSRTVDPFLGDVQAAYSRESSRRAMFQRWAEIAEVIDKKGNTA